MALTLFGIVCGCVCAVLFFHAHDEWRRTERTDDEYRAAARRFSIVDDDL